MAISTPQVYTDFSGLQALKTKARDDQSGSLAEVAKQFESLFVQMMVKSMRDASFGGGLLDSKQTEFYRDMYDQQLSIHLSEKGGIGLAEVLERQLGGNPSSVNQEKGLVDYVTAPVLRAPSVQQQIQSQAREVVEKIVQPTDVAPAPIPVSVPAAISVAQPTPETQHSEKEEQIAELTQQKLEKLEKRLGEGLGETPVRFIQSLWSAATEAANKMGIAPEALIAQAALETGWGKHVMHHQDGTNSHNLFGIKAHKGWGGDRVEVTTHEYMGGKAMNIRADFRSYGSYQDSFNDYVDFVHGNQRYQEALNNTGDAHRYFEELQKAGYATDPNYAKKIQRIMNSPEMQAVRQANVAEAEGGTHTS